MSPLLKNTGFLRMGRPHTVEVAGSNPAPCNRSDLSKTRLEFCAFTAR